MRINPILTVLVLIVFSIINVDLAFSQDDQTLEKMAADEELQQEMAWLKAETYVITPSRIPEKIKKTASSITVVTDRQIRQMGARSLVDALRTVPGMNSYYHFSGVYLKGVRGADSTRMLIMINSHPIQENQTGRASWVYDTMIVDNIKRIEILRSPASSVYGANAVIGVINIITKEAEDIDGFELTASGGSYDTQQYNLLYGKTFSDLEMAFNFNFYKTHGFRGLIEEDFQTYIDEIWTDNGVPSNFSLAPGRMDGDDEKYDAQLTLKYKGFTFDGRYVERERDLPVGLIGALNNGSITNPKDYSLTLSYDTSIWKGLDFSGKVYRNFDENPSDIQTSPPSWISTPAGLAFMPDGWISEYSIKSSRTGIEIQSTYRPSDSNTLVAGATYEEQRVYDRITKANYLPTANPNLFIQLSSVQKWPEELTQDSEKRNFMAVFIEDIWDITDDLRLTVGIRYDHYSDFGGHSSPRIGLTWEYIEGYDMKLLYAHAFRAPSFLELYSPLGGDPDLEPEKHDIYEASLGAELTPSLSSRLTLWRRKMKDSIWPSSTVRQKYVNWGKESAYGFEFEMKYDFGRGTYLAGNYGYLYAPKFSTPTEEFRNWVWPRRLGNIMANIRLSKYLNFYADCHIADDFRRDYGDDRDDMSGYAIVNTTLIARKFLKGYEGLELRGSVYNLFDKDYTSPQGTELPNDLPMPGINYLLEIKYEF